MSLIRNIHKRDTLIAAYEGEVRDTPFYWMCPLSSPARCTPVAALERIHKGPRGYRGVFVSLDVNIRVIGFGPTCPR